MEIYYGIPSYKRCGKVKTLDTLIRYGIDPSKIVISTQTMEDYEQYNKEYGHRVKVIYNEGYNASCNRNTLIEYLGNNKMVILDDDIKSIEILNGDELVDIGDKFTKFIEYAFVTASKNNVAMFGIYPVHNAFFMKNNVKLNILIEGSFIGLINNKNKFDAEYYVKEDYELSLRLIDNGYNTLRFNNITSNRDKNSITTKNGGGCAEHWAHNDKCVSKLIRQYDKYIKLNPNRPGEILMRR